MLATPWGVAQHQHKIQRGIWVVDTAGHGGIMISFVLAHKLFSQAALDKGLRYGGYFCYEEDCDWAIPVYEQTEIFAGTRCFQEPAHELKETALRSLTSWNEEYLKRFADENLTQLERRLIASGSSLEGVSHS